VFEHAVDGVQRFTYHGNRGLHSGFAVLDEVQAGVAQTSAFEVRGLTGRPARGAVFSRRVVPRCGIARFFSIGFFVTVRPLKRRRFPLPDDGPG
jgi:hypothetical protein